MTAMVVIDCIYGKCPVQADGTVDGVPFYFRARGNRWSFGVGADPVGAPEWYYQQDYKPEDPLSAGWIEEWEARAFIILAVYKFELQRWKQLPLPLDRKRLKPRTKQ